MKKTILFINCYPDDVSETVWLNFISSVSTRMKNRTGSRISQTYIPILNMADYANKEKIEIGDYCIFTIPFSFLTEENRTLIPDDRTLIRINCIMKYIREYYKNECEFVGYYLCGANMLTNVDRTKFETTINMLKMYGMDHYSYSNIIDFLIHACGTITSEKENKYMQNDVRHNNWINIGKASHTIKKVIFNNPATIVFWEDGTKTVVICTEGDVFDPEKGITMAFMKKILGNKGRYYNEIKKWLPTKEQDEDEKTERPIVFFDNKPFNTDAPKIEQLRFEYSDKVVGLNRYGEPYDKRLFYAGKQRIVCAGDCYHVRNMKMQNATKYLSLADALDDGCRPCKHCHGTHKEEK